MAYVARLAAAGVKRKIQVICETKGGSVTAPDLVFIITIVGLGTLSTVLAYMLVLGL
ncbi:hypothetical protein ACVWXO_001929 [Bradyrhizobium sp. LM2.7]